MMSEFKLQDQGTQLTPVVSVGTGEIKGVRLGSASGTGSMDFQHIARQWNPAGVANTWPQRFQAEKATLTQWAPIRVGDPLMAKDTGLREEECLDKQFESGTETHTDYNVSGRKSTKSTYLFASASS